jgi:dihydrofolate reductase
MGELHFKMSVSVDGFVAGPHDEADWIFATTDPKALEWEIAIFRNAGMHIMGSKTYAVMMAWWPFSNESVAPAMNDIPKAVFTTRGAESVKKEQAKAQSMKDANESLQKSGGQKREADPKVLKMWQDAYVAAGPIADEIAKLKREHDKPLVAHGGAGFARSLIATGLVDKFFLLVHPFALGKGLPIFTKLEKPLALRLESSTAFSSGAIGQVYRPVRNSQSA